MYQLASGMCTCTRKQSFNECGSYSAQLTPQSSYTTYNVSMYKSKADHKTVFRSVLKVEYYQFLVSVFYDRQSHGPGATLQQFPLSIHLRIDYGGPQALNH